MLAKGVAIDLDPGAFPNDRVAQSMIHHIDIVLHRVGPDAFELWVLRSFAEPTHATPYHAAARDRSILCGVVDARPAATLEGAVGVPIPVVA